MNRAGLNMIEADTLDDVKGLCVYPLVSEEYRDAFQNMTKKVFDGETRTLEFKMIGLRGRPLWLYSHAVPLRNEKGEVVSMLAVTVDITERKATEEKLRHSEEFIRSILNTVDEGFVVVDKDYRIVTANKAYCRQVGGCEEEIYGKHCYETSHRSSRPCFEEGEECAVKHVYETGEPYTALHKHTDKDGHILFVETKAYPVRDASGNIISVIETINNITEKHLLEEERLKTQKLESIGTLAGGIAHDFNNLLQVLFGFISMAKINIDDKDTALDMLAKAEKALNMSVNLTMQLLTFSKGGAPVKKILAIGPLVESAARFALSGSRVQYRMAFPRNIYRVDADEGQISQVIQNIVLNADQAMPLGGTITIAARNISVPDAEISVPLPKGKYVEICIRDTGVGIPENFIGSIFDPYFTTKERGSGLGLATSYSIVRKHGGLITVSSEVGKGTTFLIYLPAAESKPDIITETVVPVLPSQIKKGRVLVMDDEELVRNIIGEMLKSLGHEVFFAEDGEEAVALYRVAMSSGKRFDIVILDLTIRGGMGGEDTMKELLALDPEVEAIVSSGYSDSDIISDYESHGFRAYLTKPYEIDILGKMLNTILTSKN